MSSIKGIELALKNSDRLRKDTEILAKNERHNSVIPLVTLMWPHLPRIHDNYKEIRHKFFQTSQDVTEFFGE